MPTDLPELRGKWRRRLGDAKLRLDFARAFVGSYPKSVISARRAAVGVRSSDRLPQ